jgi:hypothetical protein
MHMRCKTSIRLTLPGVTFVLIGACAAPTVLAQPSQVSRKAGDWQQLHAQGYALYTTTTGAGAARSLLEISCDVATGLDHPPAINVLIRDKELASGARVELSIDGRATVFPSGLQSPSKNEFATLWREMRQGSRLEVVASDGRRISFSLRGAGRVMPAEPCGGS